MNQKRYLKKLAAPLLSLLLGCTLTACGGVEDPSQSLEEDGSTQKVMDAARESMPREASSTSSVTRRPRRVLPYEPYGCGDGFCDLSEVDWCSMDCGYEPPPCGDGYCSGSESCSTCAQDCGTCYDPNVINVPGTPQVIPISELRARAQALGVPPSVAGVPNIEQFLQSGYSGDDVIASAYPVGATSVQDFINKLFQNGIWQNTAPGQTTAALPPDAFGCQLRQVDERYNPEELVSFDAGVGLLFPSALNQGAYINLGAGSITPLHVPYPQRKPVKLVATFYKAATAPTATATDVYTSIGQLIQAANSQGGITMSNAVFDMKSASSLEEAAAKFKLDARILGGNVSARFSSTTSTQSNTVFVKFTQSLFSVFQDLGGFTPAVGQFNSNFTVSDLNRLGDMGELGYDNLPTYVRSVTYGRMLLFSVSSSSSKSELEAAVNAVYGKTNIEATAEQKKLVQESSMSVFAYGGPAEPQVATIQSGNWKDYFTLQNVPLATLKPLGYEVRRLDDHLATMSRTTRYTERTCPGARKIRIQLSNTYKESRAKVRNTGSSDWFQVLSSTGYNSAEIESKLVGAEDELKVELTVGKPGFWQSYQGNTCLKVFVDGVVKYENYYSCKTCGSRDLWVLNINKFTGDVIRRYSIYDGHPVLPPDYRQACP